MRDSMTKGEVDVKAKVDAEIDGSFGTAFEQLCVHPGYIGFDYCLLFSYRLNGAFQLLGSWNGVGLIVSIIHHWRPLGMQGLLGSCRADLVEYFTVSGISSGTYDCERETSSF